MYCLTRRYKSTWTRPLIRPALLNPLFMNLILDLSIPRGNLILSVSALSLIYGKSKLSELYPTSISGFSSLIISTNRFNISSSVGNVSTKSLLDFFVDKTFLKPLLPHKLIIIMASFLAEGIPSAL